MPVKRRRGKARMVPREEAKLWSTVFDGGSFLLYDDPDILGVDRRDFHNDARDAWGRLGRLYLDEGLGRVEAVEGCGTGRWALHTFGEPEQCP